MGISASAAGNLGKVVFQYLIILCAEVESNCPAVWPGVSERLFWPVEDPTALEGSEAGGLVKFRVVRDQIEGVVTTCVASRSIRRSPGEWARTTGAAELADQKVSQRTTWRGPHRCPPCACASDDVQAAVRATF